ncbi:hypothetical protein GCM10010919_15330 [Alishewanella longhuensis]|uniref:Peptidoglycan-binding protein CsiV n=1 Tax=Alishewanella longhuensis TaxID=1091037 RepID=A0ABQ3KWY0_9ALTE|nr:CsiV family protein [Alishewanella longhuensis]GHG66988.1 hypothetical protein GCM10010919_15330 [Alishewanella longhuensis]
MKARLLLTGCLLFNSLLLQANERWFEIEMIIFERTPEGQLQEQFPEQVTPIRLGRNIDLVTPRINPTISPLVLSLDSCHPPAVNTAATSSFIENWRAPTQLLCHQETQPLAWQRQNLFPEFLLNTQGPWPTRIAARLNGSGVYQAGPYLAENEAFMLSEVADRLRRQRQNQILLHTVWRQAPVTERRAIPSRWFAGENFSQRFDYWGQPKLAATVTPAPLALSSAALPTESITDLLEQIESRRQQLAAGVTLDQPSTAANENSLSQNQANLPTEVWQLDGLFKLHLDHYLFVNTDFNLRRLVGDKLQSINVKQSRRVISGEVHYLDHPKLGIVLQIRRFSPTAEPITDTAE